MPKKAPLKDKKTEAKPVNGTPKPKAVPAFATEEGMLPSKEWFASAEKVLDIAYETKFIDEKRVPRKVALLFLMKAREVGVQAFTALKHFSVLDNGDVGFQSAELMRSLIQRAGGQLQVLEMSDKICRIKAWRPRAWGWESSDFEFTVEEASRMGLVAGWDRRKMNKVDMLFARCSTRIGRAMFADIIEGMSYTEEEIATPREAIPPPQAQTQAPAAVAQQPSPDQADKAPSEPATPATNGGGVPEAKASPANAQEAETVVNTVTGEKRRIDQVLVTIKGQNGPEQFWSYGATGPQCDAIRHYAAQSKDRQQYVVEWLQQHGWKKLSALTEEEASALIRYMQNPTYEDGDKPHTARDEERLIKEADEPMTREQAMAEFERITEALSIGDVEIKGKHREVLYLVAMIHRNQGDNVQSVDDLSPQQILDATDTFRQWAAVNPMVVGDALSKVGAIMDREDHVS
jgi:hypothetical protein